MVMILRTLLVLSRVLNLYCLLMHALYTNVKSLKVINFQSVVNKVPLLLEGINKHNPDIILGEYLI